MGVKYDKLDLMILSELRENCKQSVRQLAKKLGTHPNTVMQRVKNLENEKIIQKYTARINFQKIGYDLHTLIFIKVDKTRKAEWDLLKYLKSFPSLVCCYAITGEFDLVAIARSRDREALTGLLKKLNSNVHISESRTNLILESFKFESDFNPLSEWLLPSSKSE